MCGKLIACLFAAVFALFFGSEVFAQTKDFRPSAKDPKDQRQFSPSGSEECERAKQALMAEAGRRVTKSVGGYSLKDIAAMTDCSHLITLADLHTDFKTDYELYWEQKQAESDKQQAAQQAAQEQQSQIWWQNFKKQQDDFWKGLQPKQQPTFPSPRLSPPRMTVPNLDGPLTPDNDPYWYQKGIDEQRDLFGGRGGADDPDPQPWWYGISGAEDGTRDGALSPDAGGFGASPAPFIRSSPVMPTPEELKAERRADAEREAAQKAAKDRTQAEANGDEMRELLGETENTPSDPLQDLLADAATTNSLDDLLSISPEAGPGSSAPPPSAPRTDAERNGDEMRELLGEGGGKDPFSDLDDLIKGGDHRTIRLPVAPGVPDLPAFTASPEMNYPALNQAKRDDVTALAKSQGVADPYSHEMTAAEIAQVVFNGLGRAEAAVANIANAAVGSPIRGVYEAESGKIRLEGIDAVGAAETAVEGKLTAPPLWQRVSHAAAIYEVGDELAGAITDISGYANSETAVETTGRVAKLLVLGQRLANQASQLENEVKLLSATNDQNEKVRAAIDSRNRIIGRIKSDALPRVYEALDREPSAVRNVAERKLGITTFGWRP